jgi:uncharacterized membrane protein HdeD (DUF308 family)
VYGWKELGLRAIIWYGCVQGVFTVCNFSFQASERNREEVCMANESIKDVSGKIWIPEENWWALLIHGILAVLFGIVVISRPGISLLLFTYIFGAYAILNGIVAIWMGITGKSSFLMMLIMGILYVLAGIMAFSWPGLTLFIFLAIIATWAIALGIVHIVTAIKVHKEEHAWPFGVSGVISLIFGILLLVWPISSIYAFALLMGVYSMLFGVTLAFMSFQLKHVREAKAR